MSEALKGACMCGACAFTAVPDDLDAGICHCGMCRKWSGGMFMVVTCHDLAFAKGAPVEAFKSSEWGRRLFCRVCGSSLAWQTADGSHTSVSIQAFEDPGIFTLTSEIFVDEKPGCYDLANDTHKMTAAEVMAMFAPKPDGERV